MVNKLNTLVLSGMLLMFLFLASSVACAQDFSECQNLVKELLPVFNRSFEENDPSLLRDETYQRGLRNLKAAYALYNKENFAPSDSVQKMNNEAVLLALSGNYPKALHIMQELELSTKNPQLQYNRGLFGLLSGKYAHARNDFAESPNGTQAKLNTLVAFAKEKKFQEALGFASSNSAKNSAGKWNFNMGLVHKYEGRLPEAADEITAAIRQKDEMAYRLQRGDILMRTGNEKRAVKDFEKVARKHPKAQIRYANALLSLNQFGAAKLVFETLCMRQHTFLFRRRTLRLMHARKAVRLIHACSTFGSSTRHSQNHTIAPMFNRPLFASSKIALSVD